MDNKQRIIRTILCLRQDRSISRIARIDGGAIKSLQRTDARRKRNARFVINGAGHYSYADVKCMLLFARETCFCVTGIKRIAHTKHGLIISFSIVLDRSWKNRMLYL